MTEADKDDLFYVCSLVEFIARKTKNKRGVVANRLGVEGFTKQQIGRASCRERV